MANKFVLTFKLSCEMDEQTHPGIMRIFTSDKATKVGDNAFLFLTSMTAEQTMEQVRRHLVDGEFVCIFSATGALVIGPTFLEEFVKTTWPETQIHPGPKPVRPLDFM